MTAPGATEFDRATAVAPLGGGAWAADIDAGWFGGPRPERRLPRRDGPACDGRRAGRPRARAAVADCHYLRPPAAGPARIDVTVERSGRATSTLTARLAQGGRQCVLGVAAFGRRARAGRLRGRRAAVPGPDEVPAADNSASGLSIVSRFDVRPALGGAMFAGPDEALTGGWLRFSDARGTDAIALAMFADAWFPAPWVRLGARSPRRRST